MFSNYYLNVCGRPFVMLSDRCLSCPVLSATLVYCGQRVGWIRMPLGTDVGFGHGHITLDGDQLSPRKGAQQPPLFVPCVLWPNGRPMRPSQLLLSSCLWSPYGIGRPYIFSCCGLFFMAALCNTGPLYFCPVISIFYLSFYLSFFPRLISAVGDWMFTILWHMVWP